MSFEVPDWNGDSFSYHLDESSFSQLQASCTRNYTGDHLKIKKRRKKQNKTRAEANTDGKLLVFYKAHENTPSLKKLKKKGGNCRTPNDTVGEETKLSKEVNLHAVSSSEKNVISKGTGKQEFENASIIRNKKNSKRNKYRELADKQRQTRSREVFGVKKGNEVIHSSSFDLPATITCTKLDSHCRKSEDVKSLDKDPVTDIAIGNISTGKECSHYLKTPQLNVKQDSYTGMALATDQWKTVHETDECNDESSQVQISEKIKKTKKRNVSQESNLNGTISRDVDGGNDAYCGDKTDKKIQSKKLKVKESESDVEIICEISDDEAGRDQTLQTDLEAFITTLGFAQFKTKKNTKKLYEDENMVMVNSLIGSSKSILVEPGDMKEKDEINSQNLKVLDQSDQGKELVTNNIHEYQVGITKGKKKTKRKKKNETVNKDEVTVSVSETTNVVSDDFVKEDKEECKEVAIEVDMNEKMMIKEKNKHTIKCKNTASSSENTSLIPDNCVNKNDKEEKKYKKDDVSKPGNEGLPNEPSFGDDEITEVKEKKIKKRKRDSNQMEYGHRDASPNKRQKFDKDKLAEMLKAADFASRPTTNQVSGAGGSLQDKMEQQLNAARFRFINERLYSTTGSEAQLIFKNDPDAFQIYHSGYQHQVSKWPINPLDLIINVLKDRPSDLVVADFGCGEAQLAKSIPQTKVHSLDLVALNPLVTACNMANSNLASESVDIVVFCLSLMGTSVCDFILEANRVLKTGGLLKVAEVESRFKNAESFVQCLAKYGFQLIKKDTSHKFFWLFDFKKKRNVKINSNLPEICLKPCVYKKR